MGPGDAALGGAAQRGGGRLRADGRRDQVEVSGADFPLVPGGRVPAGFGGELRVLHPDVGGHALGGVALREIEHR